MIYFFSSIVGEVRGGKKGIIEEGGGDFNFDLKFSSKVLESRNHSQRIHWFCFFLFYGFVFPLGQYSGFPKLGG